MPALRLFLDNPPTYRNHRFYNYFFPVEEGKRNVEIFAELNEDGSIRIIRLQRLWIETIERDGCDYNDTTLEIQDPKEMAKYEAAIQAALSACEEQVATDAKESGSASEAD